MNNKPTAQPESVKINLFVFHCYSQAHPSCVTQLVASQHTALDEQHLSRAAKKGLNDDVMTPNRE